ncbi:hypothetical protein DP73_03780 [Desulfosporosinus sp. HMP52]|nr:hypothetical protein DP73_03780 [Desulfosporosinus sp. HMP52]
MTIGLAWWGDIRTKKIKNKLTLSACLIGFALNAIFYSTQGLYFSLRGLGAGFLLMFLLYLAGVVGAGDVKLFGAVGSIMGMAYVITLYFYSILMGSLIGLVLMIWQKQFVIRVKGLFQALKGLIFFKSLEPLRDFSKGKGLKIPYMYAVLPCSIIAVILPIQALM